MYDFPFPHQSISLAEVPAHAGVLALLDEPALLTPMAPQGQGYGLTSYATVRTNSLGVVPHLNADL